MEEYAKIFRVLICFRPPHAPITTDRTEHIIIISENTKWLRFANKNRGAIFCQQATIRPLLNVKPLSTSGNQKWQGAKPNFIIRAIVIIEWVKGSLVEYISHLFLLHRFSTAPLSSIAALNA